MRGNTKQKLSKHAQTHLLATSSLLQGEGFNEDTLRRKTKLLTDDSCCLPPASAHRLAMPH